MLFAKKNKPSEPISLQLKSSAIKEVFAARAFVPESLIPQLFTLSLRSALFCANAAAPSSPIVFHLRIISCSVLLLANALAPVASILL